MHANYKVPLHSFIHFFLLLLHSWMSFYVCVYGQKKSSRHNIRHIYTVLKLLMHKIFLVAYVVFALISVHLCVCRSRFCFNLCYYKVLKCMCHQSHHLISQIALRVQVRRGRELVEVDIKCMRVINFNEIMSRRMMR